MKRFITFLGIICLCACTGNVDVEKSNPDHRYFGLHFDFHASPSDYYLEHPIGGTLKEDEIREICRQMKLDFLQIDCKGHPGWTSYPSKCGNAIPQIQADPLKIWRSVTKEEGVKLFMHYSGVWDNKYALENPQQAVLLPDLTRSDIATRTNGKYVDELMIPQMKELAGDYGVDGMWVDGDCWGSRADFDPATVAEFEKETGISLEGKLPVRRGMPYFNEYRDFCRNLFRRYVNHYVDALHSEYPSFKIASNWAFTDHMPEKVCADVDYISGDLSPENSFWWARFSGRSMEKQGKPWDLMAWGFRNTDCRIYKTPAQMMQEASAVIALGGGFQVYIIQLYDGSPRMDKVRALYPLADFMHARKEWCFQGHMEPQVAVLLSTFDRYRESDELFSRNGCDKAMSMVNLLCDAGHSVSIVSEHDLLEGKINSYPVIVIPELFEGLEDDTMNMLSEYVSEHGGSLILNGKNTCKLFEEKGFPGGEEIALLKPEPLAADVKEYGKGKVAAFACDVAKSYSEFQQSRVTDLVNDILLKMYAPRAEILECRGLLEIVDLWKDGKMLIQLVNANGLHHATNSLIEKSIAPVTDICLKIKLENKPSAIRLQPDAAELKFTWKDGFAYVAVPRVDIHNVIEIK